jgi:hypothetical protein
MEAFSMDKSHRKRGRRIGRKHVWQRLVWRVAVIGTALLIGFVSTVTFLWDEIFPQVERPHLINLLQQVPGPYWAIIGLAAVVLLMVEGVRLWINQLEGEIDEREKEHDETKQLLTDKVQEIQSLEDEIRADKPNFQVNINNIMSARSTATDAIVIAVGVIKNSGGAGAVAEFWIDLEIDGRTTSGAFPVVPTADDRLYIGKSASGNDLYLLNADYWARSARVTPIPKFSSRDGWLTAIFRGVTKEEIVEKKANIVVTCSDVFGNKYKGERRFTGVNTDLFAIGEMQPGEAQSESLSQKIANNLRSRGSS